MKKPEKKGIFNYIIFKITFPDAYLKVTNK